MKYSWIDTELLQKPSVTKDLQAEWNWIRYHIGGKMFAAVCLDDTTGKPVYITCKLDPAEGDFLRRQYEDIIPGYYMNKVHWNSVKAEGNVPDALLREMLEKILSSGAGQLQQKEAAHAAGRGKEGCHLTTRKNIKSSISRRRNRKSSPFLR